MFHLLLELIQLSIIEIREMFKPEHVNILFKTSPCIARVSDQFLWKPYTLMLIRPWHSRARLVFSEFFHWTRWILDTCPNLAMSNEKNHWTQALPGIHIRSCILLMLRYFTIKVQKTCSIGTANYKKICNSITVSSYIYDDTIAICKT